MTLLEVKVRDRQQTKEDERVDDVQHAEIACVTPAEMRDASRHQRNRESCIGKLLHLEWDRRYDERQDPQDLSDGQLNLEICREDEMNESALRAVRKGEVVVEHKIDDAEEHDGNDQSGGRAIDHAFAIRQTTDCTGCHNILPDVRGDRARPDEEMRRERQAQRSSMATALIS